MIGFASCLGLGMLMSVVSMFMWAKPVSFALLYTFGASQCLRVIYRYRERKRSVGQNMKRPPSSALLTLCRYDALSPSPPPYFLGLQATS